MTRCSAVITLGIVYLLSLAAPSAAVDCANFCTPQRACYLTCYPGCPPLECNPITCGEWGVCNGDWCNDAQGEMDMVEWMRQTYPNSSTTHLKAAGGTSVIDMDSCNFTDGFYMVISPSGLNYVRHTYDSTNVLLTREGKDDSCTHYRTFGNYAWLKRCMKSGDTFTTNCTWTEYTSCGSGTVTNCSEPVTLTGPTAVAFGGDLGTLQAIKRKEVLGDNSVEYYWYAKPYGLVKWEHRDAGGGLIASNLYNDIVAGQEKPHKSSCYTLECTGEGTCP